MEEMDEGIEQPCADQASIGAEDSDEKVLLRSDSRILRENRRQSRERTPTALVSRAFDFLNEDVFSSVNISDFDIDPSDIQKELNENKTGDDSLYRGKDIKVEETDALVRECKSKDSGFASLERQLDKETVKSVFSAFDSECDTVNEHSASEFVANACFNETKRISESLLDNEEGSYEICLADSKSIPTCNTSTDEENASHSHNEGQVCESCDASSVDINDSKESGNNLFPINNELEENNHSDLDSDTNNMPPYKETSSVSHQPAEKIKEKVELVMKVLQEAFDIKDDVENDDDHDDVQDDELVKDNKYDSGPIEDTISESSLPAKKSGIAENSQSDKSTEILEKEPESKIALVESEAKEDNAVDVTVKTASEVNKENGIETESLRDPKISEGHAQTSDEVDVENDVKRRSRENDSKIIKIERTHSNDANSDDSSDEDTGIYAESFRRSNWVRVSKEGKLQLHIPTPPVSGSSIALPPRLSEAPESAEDSVDGGIMTPSLTSEQSNADDVFELSGAKSNWMHKRSDSTTSTASETEFQRKYVSRRKCLIQRADSQQEYHRLSARIYEQDKEVILERNSECQDLGLHLLDSHPAFITSVDPDSPADKAGIVEGQILVSVNDVSVLTTNHADIIDLIQKCEGSISLGVANSDFQPVRDLQAPVITGYLFKLGHSTLVRMWKKRYFILRQDNCLYYYKNEQELDPLGALPLCGYTISRHTETNKDYCFKAEKYGARSYFFMTDSRDQMTEWVGAMTQAAARSKKRKESFLSVSSHNVSLPALDIRRPECSGYLGKLTTRTWRRRYCVLKDACIYYYKDVNSLSALGVAHLHGYTVDVAGHPKKKNSFSLLPPDPKMRIFYFSLDNDTDKKRWVESLIHSIQRWVKVDS